ncbi:6-phosphofructokinase [Chloroflexota bacterium]
MKKLCVLTSGGDAPGMNAGIRAVVRAALGQGVEVVGARRGYSGLVEGDFIRMNRRAVANIIQRGGTILESSRCEEMKSVEGRKQAIGSMEKEGIDTLVVIGGDGTFRGAAAIAEESQVKVAAVAATIDNDVYGTDYTIGFDTAVNTALECIDRIRDTADAHALVFFVEVMGRSTGFIALEVSIAGGAEVVIIPEEECELEELCHSLKDSFKKGKRSSLVVVAEGNEVGHTMQIAQYVQYRLKTNCRVCVLGHLQRGGAPTARDRVLASRLGTAAVDGVLNGKVGHMVGEVGGKIVYQPMPLVLENKKALDRYSLESLKVLA